MSSCTRTPVLGHPRLCNGQLNQLKNPHQERAEFREFTERYRDRVIAEELNSLESQRKDTHEATPLFRDKRILLISAGM